MIVGNASARWIKKMARKVHEIMNFNVGTVSNADPRETPEDAPILSYNVDANAPGGILTSRPKDTYKNNDIEYSQIKVLSAMNLKTSLDATSTSVDIKVRFPYT